MIGRHEIYGGDPRSCREASRDGNIYDSKEVSIQIYYDMFQFVMIKNRLSTVLIHRPTQHLPKRPGTLTDVIRYTIKIRSNSCACDVRRSLCICTLIALIWPGGYLYGAESGHSAQSFSIELVQQAVHRSASYLAGLVDDNGRFKYRSNMNPEVQVKARYNMLRHAGAVYALAMYSRTQPEETIRAALERAVRYFRRTCIDEVPHQTEMLAVWSRPEITNSNQALEAKLGGAGLGIVALVSAEKIIPGSSLEKDLRRLGRFITFMQKVDGSFYSKYVPSEGGRQDDWESLYYPGEAALGLLMLYDIDPAAVWLQSAKNALLYLARRRKNRSEVPADHWALIATDKILRVKHVMLQPADYETLEAHAWQITEAILSEQIIDDSNSGLHGGFVADGRTTPTSTRLEGLLASRSIFSNDEAKIALIDPAIRRGIEFLLRSQVSGGKFAGAFPRAIGKISPVFQDAGKFNRRSEEVRIDYVQHALCALMQFAALSRAEK